MLNKTQNISVEGMTCVNCKKILAKSILHITGVSKVNIKLSTKVAIVVFDSSKTTETKIVEQITIQGYEVIT